MLFQRSSAMIRSAGLRTRPALSATPRAFVQRRLQQGYGDGKGNPASEQPEQQGKNPSENIEHPGPPPPKVAQGKSPSPDEKAPSSNEKPPSQSKSSESKSSGGKGNKADQGKQAQASGGNSKGGKGNPQPKILSENPPSESEQSEGVKQHNEEMEHRHERAHEGVSNKDAEKDKVSKGFWSGTSSSTRHSVGDGQMLIHR